LFKPDESEFSARIALLNGHHAMIFQCTLEMFIGRRLLPKCVRFG